MKLVRNKLLLVFIFLITFFTINAQKLSHGFGVSAIMGSANYIDSSVHNKPTQMKPGFRVYWLGKVNLEGNLSFAPEVGYVMKSFKVSNPYPSNVVKEQEITIHAIEFKFIEEYTIKQKYFVKVGPSISAAFAGNDKQVFNANNTTTNTKLPFDFSQWGRFEAAVNVSIGMHITKDWLAEIGLTKGISNIWEGDGGPSVKPKYYGISIAKFLR